LIILRRYLAPCPFDLVAYEPPFRIVWVCQQVMRTPTRM
jgi:hypothetical protein